MSKRSADDVDFGMLSQAVQRWYRHYEEAPTDAASTVLCIHAIKLFNEGIRSEDLIAAALIDTYIGISATRVNAIGSEAVH